MFFFVIYITNIKNKLKRLSFQVCYKALTKHLVYLRDLCLFNLSLFLRLCVDILCLFFFLPLGIIKKIYKLIKQLQ